MQLLGVQVTDTSSICVQVLVDSVFRFETLEEAWQEIKNDERVMLTVDLFFLGIVFFKSDFKTKQHFIIRF